MYIIDINMDENMFAFINLFTHKIIIIKLIRIQICYFNIIDILFGAQISYAC